MDQSFCLKNVKLISDKEKIKTLQRKQGLPELDVTKLLGKIFPAVSEKGHVVKVQYFDGKNTVHIDIHRDLLEEAHYSSYLDPKRETEFDREESSKKIKTEPKPKKAEPKLKKDERRSIVSKKTLAQHELIEAIKNDSITDISQFFKNKSQTQNINMMNVFHCAAFHGKEAHMKTLLENGADAMSSDDDGDSALHIAIFGKRYGTTCYLTKTFPLLLNKANKKFQTPLLLAATNNLTDILMELLNFSNIDINAQDDIQNTALHYILKHNNDQVLERILSYAEINVKLTNGDGDSPFHYACYFNSKECIRILITYCKRRTNFAILDQLRKSNVSGQQLLLQKNIDLAHELITTHHRKWSRDPLQERTGTILHFVVKKAIPKVVTSLITIDPALINIINSSKKTALDLALEMYSSGKETYIEGREMASTLYHKGAKCNMEVNKNILKRILSI